jgi:sugar/nucleoside kinase (ribokinase family)
MNREEAVCLVLSKNNRINIKDEKEILKALYEMTGGLIVITDGGNGSYATDGKVDFYVPSSADKLIETTGAGDAYCSTFVAGQILGYGVKGSMKLAAMNAGNVVAYVGAQKGLMTIRELRDKIELGGKDEIFTSKG